MGNRTALTLATAGAIILIVALVIAGSTEGRSGGTASIAGVAILLTAFILEALGRVEAAVGRLDRNLKAWHEAETGGDDSAAQKRAPKQTVRTK